MKAKLFLLAALGVVALASPVLEQALTGRLAEMSAFDIGSTLVEVVLIFWWYHLDKEEHGYRAGPLMNGAILLLAVLAFPVYFVRSRGWKKGLLATAVAAVVLGALLGLGELGEWISGAIG